MSKALTVGLNYFNIETDKLPTLSDFKDLNEVIIIFDDLERCGIDVNQMLGILNNLVEHNDIKVILIANQDKVGKMSFFNHLEDKYNVALNNRLVLSDYNDKKNNKSNEISFTKDELVKRTEELFSEDTFYKKVKEKLIGLTIYYQPDFNEVFEEISIKLIHDKHEKTFLSKYKSDIINIFVEKNHYNIRTLIFGLIAFDKFYTIINDEKDKENNETILDSYIEQELVKIMKYTMISAIKIKLGKFIYMWEDNSRQSGEVHYSYNVYGFIYGYKFVDDYLLNCNLNKKEIKAVVLENAWEQKKLNDERELMESLQYRKLQDWWELEDDEVKQTANSVLEELQAGKYDPINFKDIIITLMQMKHYGFDFVDYETFINPMVEKLNKYEGGFERLRLETFSDVKDFVEQYNEIAKPLFKIVETKTNKNKEINYSFLCVKDNWNDEFCLKCQSYSSNFLEDKKFFYYIDPQEFISQLKKATILNIRNFTKGIKKVYDFSNLNDYFTADSSNIKTILELMKDIDSLAEGKITRKMALEDLKKKLIQSLELIDSSTCY